MTIVELVKLFNTVARTEYNRTYQAFPETFKDLIFQYNSGLTEGVDFPFFEFLDGMQKWTGQRKHQIFPDGFKFRVLNEKWDMAVDIPIEAMERAAGAASRQLQGLDIYRQRISQMADLVMDHPLELAYDMLIAGAATTYGTCFDSKALFSTAHGYNTTGGSQSNLVTGTGTTLAAVKTDLLTVRQNFMSYYYEQGGTALNKRRKLNKSRDIRIKVVCPIEMDDVFFQLISKNLLSDTLGDNEVKTIFEYEPMHMADANDWYAVLKDGDKYFKPILHQIEVAPKLDFPTVSDESVRELDLVTYGARGRYNLAYGAWWKAQKVTNV